MHKSQAVIGLDVLHLKTGKKIGLVRDILFDSDQSFRGILLEDGVWLKRRKYIPKENIRSIGKDAVMIENDKQILPMDESAQEWMGIQSGHKKLKGLPILLASGYELGVIENVYFMEEMGTLIGYELSDGWISDITEGRKIIKTSEPLVWGSDALIATEDQIKVQQPK